MRLLVNADRRKLASMMDATNLHLIEQAQNYADVRFHGEGWPEYHGESILEAEEKFQPHAVLYWGDLVSPEFGMDRFSGADALRAPAILNIQDHWQTPNFRREVFSRFRFKAMLTRWIAGVQRTYPELGSSLVHLCLPH